MVIETKMSIVSLRLCWFNCCRLILLWMQCGQWICLNKFYSLNHNNKTFMHLTCASQLDSSTSNTKFIRVSPVSPVSLERMALAIKIDYAMEIAKSVQTLSFRPYYRVFSILCTRKSAVAGFSCLAWHFLHQLVSQNERYSISNRNSLEPKY